MFRNKYSVALRHGLIEAPNAPRNGPARPGRYSVASRHGLIEAASVMRTFARLSRVYSVASRHGLIEAYCQHVVLQDVPSYSVASRHGLIEASQARLRKSSSLSSTPWRHATASLKLEIAVAVEHVRRIVLRGVTPRPH